MNLPIKILLFALMLLTGCSDSDRLSESALRKQNQKGEFIYRMHNEFFFLPEPAEKKARALYPWESEHAAHLPKITREYFRCKGSNSNPVHVVEGAGEAQRYYDCGGSVKHSLPYRDDKEFVYPILIDLLTYVQNKTGKRVCITSGHRCPDHNTYVDPSPANRYSKHMIGAEVSFYVQGLEQQPEAVIEVIKNFYHTHAEYRGKPEYSEFKRYDKGETDVSTMPWHNKEIFIKLFKRNEGRNFDNRHPYPYISIQVRWDRDKQEKVIYTWEAATQKYLRR